MVWPSPSLSTLNGMALVHTWHFNRDGDAPWKNHQDGWLLPHSEAKPFCLAESPPTAHWAHETWGTGPACIKYTGTSHSSHSYKAGRDSDGLLLSCLETQDWGTKVTEMRYSLLSATQSLNLRPVLGCQAPSQTVTLSMAVNSQSVSYLPYW